MGGGALWQQHLGQLSQSPQLLLRPPARRTRGSSRCGTTQGEFVSSSEKMQLCSIKPTSIKVVINQIRASLEARRFTSGWMIIKLNTYDTPACPHTSQRGSLPGRCIVGRNTLGF